MSHIGKMLIVISLLPWVSVIWLDWHVSQTGVVHSNEPRNFAILVLNIVASITAVYLVGVFLWFRRQRFSAHRYIPHLSCIAYFTWLTWLGWPFSV